MHHKIIRHSIQDPVVPSPFKGCRQILTLVFNYPVKTSQITVFKIRRYIPQKIVGQNIRPLSGYHLHPQPFSALDPALIFIRCNQRNMIFVVLSVKPADSSQHGSRTAIMKSKDNFLPLLPLCLCPLGGAYQAVPAVQLPI